MAPMPKPPRFIDSQLNYGRETIVELVRRCPPLRSVVDLGAGSGTDLRNISAVAPDAELHGVEVYPPNQELLRAAGITVHGLDIERDQLPFGDETIDLVISNQTFEHMKDIFWALHELTRVLTIGGHFIIGVPNLASLHNRVLLAAGQQPTAILSASAHVRGYTYRDLVSLVGRGEAGWIARAHRGSNFYPLPAGAARAAARLFPSMAWSCYILFQKTAPYGGAYLRWPVEERLETNFYLGPASS
jgi:SAM-dependent methyltransferase